MLNGIYAWLTSRHCGPILNDIFQTSTLILIGAINKNNIYNYHLSEMFFDFYRLLSSWSATLNISFHESYVLQKFPLLANSCLLTLIHVINESQAIKNRLVKFEFSLSTDAYISSVSLELQWKAANL